MLASPALASLEAHPFLSFRQGTTAVRGEITILSSQVYFELGFSPVPLRPKRESIEWTRHYSPEECVRMMRTLKSLNATYDSLVDRLERAANQLNSVNTGATFEELLTA